MKSTALAMAERVGYMWESLLVRKSGYAGGRGFAPRPGQ